MSLISYHTIPALAAEFRCNYVIAESESPFALSTQAYDWGGARWEGEITIEAVGWDEVSQMRGFLAAAKGKFNTFLCGDPEYLIRGPRGAATGTPLVNGAGQTGLSLVTDGWTNSITGIVKAGDYVQLGSGASSQLYMSTADVNSNGSGQATIPLNRPLLSSPADNSAVVIAGAKGVFKLADNMVGWSENPSGVTRYVLPIKEAL